ncbi:MAG: glutamine-hydrolyzing carbamoyl-phosphate synthase small subunit [Candidatus Micrarchaeota archaeon]
MLLNDGTCYLGRHFGAEIEALGELVFNTSMTGYQEAITDPSYAGQILTFAYPLQGNYGINKEDSESDKVHVRAVVAREVCTDANSHYRSVSSLGEHLRSNGIPGISNIDTRSIVRRVREHGVMPAAITPLEKGLSDGKIREKLGELHSKICKYDYGSINFVADVSTEKRKEFPAGKSALKNVALIDCGVKLNIIRELNARKIDVTAFPYNVSADELLKGEPDGILISNGPGDPSLMNATINTTKSLLGKLPIFGICLGHQIIAHALGGTTYKLKFGHRGSNHAVVNPSTGKIYITTQNHGFAAKDIPEGVAEALFVNCNDGTNEGLRHRKLPIISSQFHPEGACGPKDANFLFDEFMKMMK